MISFYDTPLDGVITSPAAEGSRPRFDAWDAVYPGSREAAARLADPGALAVTTGQQPGLFTGPLFTIHKALSARAVARALEARWGRPVVPVFWVAGDDHDFAEASRTAWLGQDGSIVTAELPARAPTAPLTPLFREPLPSVVDELVARLGATTPAGDAQDSTLAWLARHFRSGAPFAAAAGGALAEVLAPFGVVCVDGSAAAIKRRAWPVLRRALREHSALDRVLSTRSASLVESGRDPGVRLGDGATLVMLEAGAGRDRLLAGGDHFVTRRGGEAFTLDALERMAAEDPERLSANVLLRPVVEATVLPTVAYVGGPAELRYLELAGALYGPLEVAPQRPVPRWSGLLLEPRITRSLAKLGVDPERFLEDGHAVEQQVLRDVVPASLTGALQALRHALEEGYGALTAEIVAIDPTLEKPSRSALAGALNGVDGLEKRVLQALKRRQAEAMAQIARIGNALVPNGRPQERVLGLPGFLARYGDGVLQDLAAHIDGWYAAALEAPRPPA